MSFDKACEIIFNLLKDIKDNTEILFYYDSYFINPLYNDKLCKINCRNTFSNYKCKECDTDGINYDSEIKIVYHNNKCRRFDTIRKIKNILLNPVKSRVLSDREFKFLPESDYSSFKVGTSYGYYQRPDNLLHELGNYEKIIDTNSSPHEESPVTLFFSKETIEFEFYRDKENIKFVELQ